MLTLPCGKRIMFPHPHLISMPSFALWLPAIWVGPPGTHPSVVMYSIDHALSQQNCGQLVKYYTASCKRGISIWHDFADNPENRDKGDVHLRFMAQRDKLECHKSADIGPPIVYSIVTLIGDWMVMMDDGWSQKRKR